MLCIPSFSASFETQLLSPSVLYFWLPLSTGTISLVFKQASISTVLKTKAALHLVPAQGCHLMVTQLFYSQDSGVTFTYTSCFFTSIHSLLNLSHLLHLFIATVSLHILCVPDPLNYSKVPEYITSFLTPSCLFLCPLSPEDITSASLCGQLLFQYTYFNVTASGKSFCIFERGIRFRESYSILYLSHHNIVIIYLTLTMLVYSALSPKIDFGGQRLCLTCNSNSNEYHKRSLETIQ